MRISKKIACFLFAACMAVSVLAVPNTKAYAQAKVSSEKMNITVNSTYTNQIEITYSEGDAQIKNIKTNSKNLIAKQTYQYYHQEAYTYSERPYGYARIGLFAKKAGNYRVTFDVCGPDGSKKSSHSLRVKAGNSDRNESPVKKATFAGKETFFELCGKKSGKFKVEMNKGYKLKSITMITDDANGKSVEKKIKNNTKVTLGEYAYKSEDDYTYYDYDYDPVTYQETRRERWSYYLYSDMFAQTEFRVEYVNTKTKTQGTAYFSLYRIPKN